MWLPRKVASPLVHCPPPPAQAPNSGIILDSSLLHTPPSHLSTHPVGTVFGIYPDPDHISPPPLLPPQGGPHHHLSLDSGLTGLPASALALCGPFSTQGKGRSFLNVRQIRSSLRSISSTPPVSLRAKALPPLPPPGGTSLLSCLALLQPHWPACRLYTFQPCSRLKGFALALPSA